VTIFHCFLGRSHKTGLTVYVKYIFFNLSKNWKKKIDLLIYILREKKKDAFLYNELSNTVKRV
jgi:hypothetical protein